MNNPGNVRILVVDDETGIRDFLELGLSEEGYQVVTAQDGPTAITVANEFEPHVIVLDVMMPGMDGYEVCSMLKKRGNYAIIMLTAKDGVTERVRGLAIGADDYVVKPFSFQELLARIYARVRSQFPEVIGEFQTGDFRIDDSRKEIYFKKQMLALSTLEYELLKYFLINHDLVLSKRKILESVWGYDFGGQENIVEVYVRSLREKLNDKKHELIRTIRGAGYRIQV